MHFTGLGSHPCSFTFALCSPTDSVLTQGAHLPRPGRPVFSGYNLKTVRWMGILQRIAIAYLIVGALEIVANALAAWLGKRTTSDGAAKAQVRNE